MTLPNSFTHTRAVREHKIIRVLDINEAGVLFQVYETGKSSDYTPARVSHNTFREFFGASIPRNSFIWIGLQ